MFALVTLFSVPPPRGHSRQRAQLEVQPGYRACRPRYQALLRRLVHQRPATRELTARRRKRKMTTSCMGGTRTHVMPPVSWRPTDDMSTPEGRSTTLPIGGDATEHAGRTAPLLDFCGARKPVPDFRRDSTLRTPARAGDSRRGHFRHRARSVVTRHQADQGHREPNAVATISCWYLRRSGTASRPRSRRSRAQHRAYRRMTEERRTQRVRRRQGIGQPSHETRTALAGGVCVGARASARGQGAGTAAGSPGHRR